MKVRSDQSGFSVVEVVIAIVVLGLIGLVGYNLYTKQADNKAANGSTSQSATATDVPAAPEVASTSDLDKSSTILDEADTTASSDAAALDSQLQSF
ncbi:MAG TPA: prepilin-type N-terminal cleavage/methylation domain-containing protein [Ktedonobacteraceae bacterium]|nr:prepilin-type N-terminal cleavage/methylation domain-containing protein [Ktedonobacteraceae bacterium]